MIWGLFFVTLHDCAHTMTMKTPPILLCAALRLGACGGNAARGRKSAAATRITVPAAPREYTYRVKAVYPHATDAYTQGLQYVDGTLWEGTGQHGASRVMKTDLGTGRTELFARLPRSEFGEGITLLDGRLYYLTWQSNTAHVYDVATGRHLRDFRYPGEGWGLTTDGERLYLSDGTESIHVLDPETFRRERRITVPREGEPVRFLNELEWIDGRIWANVYTTDQIIIIDPATGTVEGVVDLTGLLPQEDRTRQTDVLNGIAWDAAGGRIFVTGKNWPKLFEIEILPK